MTIHIEFYGIPRARAGTATAELPAGDKTCLGDVLRELADRFPNLAAECFEQGRLRSGFTANLDGKRFVTDPATCLLPGTCLLIMSTDAGG